MPLAYIVHLKLLFHFSGIVAKRSVFQYFVNTQVELMIWAQYCTLRLATKPLKWKTGLTYDTPRIRRVSYGYHTNTRIILYIYALRLRILCSRNNEIPLLFRYDAVEVENDLMCVSYEHAYHKDVSDKYLLNLFRFFPLIEHFGAF